MKAMSVVVCAIFSAALVAGPVAFAGTGTLNTVPNGHAHSGTYKAGQSRQDVAKQCKEEAADNGLKGADRKAFLSDCTGKQAQSSSHSHANGHSDANDQPKKPADDDIE